MKLGGADVQSCRVVLFANSMANITRKIDGSVE
jgi:hypothetical protein